jgi:tRNA(fMet)-specific endonuclease VapC
MNILIAAIRGVPAMRERLEAKPLTALRLSTIVLGELAIGVEKSAFGERNRVRLAALAQRLPVLDVDVAASRHYGRIRAQLERQGIPIGGNDAWIAAQALAAEAVLVTDNEREFSRVPGLTIENWLH